MKCLVESNDIYEELFEGQAGDLFLVYYYDSDMHSIILWHSAEALSLNYDLLIKSHKKSFIRFIVACVYECFWEH